MNKKLFTFIEFLNEGLVYEAKEPGYAPTEEQIMQILKLQQAIGENYKKLNPKKSDFKAYLEAMAKKGMSDAAGTQFLIKAYLSLEVFNSISDASKKDAVIKGIQNGFAKKGIKEDDFKKAIAKLETLSKQKDNYRFSIMLGEKKGPFKITVTSEEMDVSVDNDVTPPVIGETVTLDLIDPAKASYFFKNNMYSLDETKMGETFEDSEYANQVLDSIDEFIENSFAFYNRGEEGKKSSGVDSIIIRTSCNRYRNTEPAENLSWADLGYKRAEAFSSYILKSAKEISGDNGDFVDMIAKTIKIDYLGSNGDGTSGPDPDKNQSGQPVKKGHYIKKGDAAEWVPKGKGSLVDVEIVPIEIGDKSNPILGTTPSTKKAKDVEGNEMTSAPANPKDYDQFKYIFIELTSKKFESAKDDTFPGDELPGGYEKVSNYFVQVKFPSGKMEGGGGGGGRKRRSKTRIKRGKAPKRQDHNPLPCAAYN
jgi:hypothetical protein